MSLFDLAGALARIAVQESAPVANSARTANPRPPIPPEAERISKTSGISEAGEFCAAEHTELPIPAPEPTGHCPACGSPSWWRSPSSSTWTCSYCSPRDRSRVEAVESVTLASGQWAPGCAQPIPATVTTDDVLALHGPLLLAGTVRTLDALELADDGDLLDLLDADLIAGFAAALVADGRIRPLPDPNLPPLARLAAEIGEPVADLRAWMDQTGPGRALRVRIEREPGACDRALLGLRADPTGGLLPVLARAMDGASVTADAPRPDDGRVQNAYGAWRTPAAHEAIAAFDAHHWRCDRCRRAGRGYGDRCPDGAALHALTRN